MADPPEPHGVLACVTSEDENAAAVISEASRLAGKMNAPLCVIHLYPAGWRGPLRPHPNAWHLITDEPAEAVRRYAERNRVKHIVFARTSYPCG